MDCVLVLLEVRQKVLFRVDLAPDAVRPKPRRCRSERKNKFNPRGGEYIDKPIEPEKHYFVLTDAPTVLSGEDRLYGKNQFTRDDSFITSCPILTKRASDGFCHFYGSD